MPALRIPNEIRERHTYIIGRSRYGKTNLVKNLIIQTMEQGAFGLSFLDVHGDAAAELIGNYPPHRLKDVVYWDPSEAHAPAFNIFAVPYSPDKLTNDIVGFLKHLYQDNWGQRMDYILTHGVYTLITDMRDNQVAHSFKDLERILKDAQYRTKIIARSTRESEVLFWRTEFPRMGERAIDPILNKISNFFLSGSLSERVFSQEENDLDLNKIMNEGKFLIANLARGKLGKRYSAFLGSVLMQGLVEAAFARAIQNPTDRRVHHLFVDEFQEFLDAPFGDILSQTGKYKLALTMSHQHTGQLRSSPGLEEDIFANVSTVICFRVKPKDAVKMTQLMSATRDKFRWHGHSIWQPLSELQEAAEKRILQELKQRTQPSRPKSSGPNGYFKEFSPKPRALSVQQTIPDWRESELQWALSRVSGSGVTAEALKDVVSYEFGKSDSEIDKSKGYKLFPPVHFQQDQYPSVSDLLNLPRFKAYCQVDTADNVRRFGTRPAPASDPKRVEAVNERNKKRYLKRLEQRKQNIPPPSSVSSPVDDDHDPDDDIA